MFLYVRLGHILFNRHPLSKKKGGNYHEWQLYMYVQEKNYRLQEQRTIRRFCRCRMAAAAGTAAPVHQENSNCLDIREHPF
jgi:hypothetical protein